MTEEKQLVRTAALITNHRRQAAHHEEDLMKHLGKSPVNTKVAVAVVSILLMAAAAGATQPGTWAAKADLPENLYFMATAEVSGIIYTFGGSSGEGIVGTVYAYDAQPGSDSKCLSDPIGFDYDSWSMRADMPTARTMAAAAEVDGKIYVIGGALDTSNFTATGVVEVYDPASDSWEARHQAEVFDTPTYPKGSAGDLGPRSMPAALWSPAAAVVDGKIYVIGGGAGNPLGECTVSSTVYVYDPASNSWDTAADMPTARALHSVSVVDGLIYAVGGSLENSAGGALEVYDPAIDSWMIAADMPTPRDCLATAAVDGKVYAFGGFAQPSAVRAGVINDRDETFEEKSLTRVYEIAHAVEVFNPRTGYWQQVGRMPDQRFGMGAAVLGDTIHLIGGGSAAIDLLSAGNHVDTFNPKLYTSWTEGAANLEGANGSRWQTDICAMNPHNERVAVALVLHTDTKDFAQIDEIGPSQQKAFSNVIGQMGVDGKGLLEIRSDQPLRMAGRTFSEDGSGTYGQFCQFQAMDDGFAKGDQVFLVGLRKEQGLYRSNLNFANTGIREAALFVSLYRCSGEHLCSFAIEDLMPGRLDQYNEPFAGKCGSDHQGWAYAQVDVIEGAGVRISASVIDSRTNDATTIVAER